jgi:enoyl-[acyl-carrier protein] reductase I
VLKPALILLDEPTSALDRTVQRQVVELLRSLQAKYNLTYLFISHDLAVVKALSHQLMVVKHGQVVEQGDAQASLPLPNIRIHSSCWKPLFWHQPLRNNLKEEQHMGFLAGKRVLIVGVASKLSIASGIAAAMHREGAELAFTYQNDKLKGRVEEFAQGWGSSPELCFPCDVASDEEIAKVFEELSKKWDGLDCIVHSVGFAPGDQLDGDFTEATTREGFRIAHDISAYSFVALAKAGREMMKGRNGSLLTLSYLGAERTMPNYNVMGMAKASLEAGVRYLAGSLGPDGTRVNCVSAGPIRTLAASGIKNFRKMLAANEAQTHCAATSPSKKSATPAPSCAPTWRRASAVKSCTWTAASTPPPWATSKSNFRAADKKPANWRAFSCLRFQATGEQLLNRLAALAVTLQQHHLAIERQLTQFDHPHPQRVLQPQSGSWQQRNPKPALDHFHNRFQLIQLQRYLDVYPLLTQKPRHQSSAKRVAVVAHLRMIGEQLQRIIALDRCRHDQNERFATNHLRRQLLGQFERRLDHDRQIDFPGIHLAQQVQRHPGTSFGSTPGAC